MEWHDGSREISDPVALSLSDELLITNLQAWRTKKEPGDSDISGLLDMGSCIQEAKGSWSNTPQWVASEGLAMTAWQS